jgi:hypothetical protein
MGGIAQEYQFWWETSVTVEFNTNERNEVSMCGRRRCLSWSRRRALQPTEGHTFRYSLFAGGNNSASRLTEDIIAVLEMSEHDKAI